MKALFDFIKAAILANVTSVKAVEQWNNQTGRERDIKNEKPLKHPAVLIEFITEDVRNHSMGIKDIYLTVRFRFALEGYKFMRLSDLDFQDTFDTFMQSFRGNGTAVYFSTMQESLTELDESHDQVNEPFIDYKTVWRKTSAYKRATDIVTDPEEQEVVPAITVDVTNDVNT